jgi:GTPase Era involved in 16S rRNA processing
MKKHKLDEKFVSSCRHSIQHSSLIGVLHDVSNHWTRGSLHPIILDLLREYNKIPSVLILNKIDKLRSKRSLLELVKTLTCNNISLDKFDKKKMLKPEEDKPIDPNREHEKTSEVGWPGFKGVFMVSSLNGDGVNKLVEFIESQSEIKPWEYKNEEVTDQTPEELIVQFVRARLLDYLPQEIPYLLSSTLEYFSNENCKIFASVIISCPTERIEKLVCGVGDGKLRQITDRVTSDLIQSFKVPVTLTLTTVVIKKQS